MSILALLVAVGVAGARTLGSHESVQVFEPMASTSRARRICAELCLAGLGGEPCGEGCLDLLPTALPTQSASDDNPAAAGSGGGGDNDVGIARRDACPVLCSNHLGYPLCNCASYYPRTLSLQGKVDYIQICSYFCLEMKHNIQGCQPCAVYRQVEMRNGGERADFFAYKKKRQLRDESPINWELWCREQCSEGNGGAACNCDLLPMLLSAKVGGSDLGTNKTNV